MIDIGRVENVEPSALADHEIEVMPDPMVISEQTHLVFWKLGRRRRRALTGEAARAYDRTHRSAST